MLTPEPTVSEKMERERLIASETAMTRAYEAWRTEVPVGLKRQERSTNAARTAYAAAWRAALRTPHLPVQEEDEGEREREMESVLRWIGGLTVHPDDAQILPAAMSHVTQSAFVRIVQDRVRRSLPSVAEEPTMNETTLNGEVGNG